MMKKIPITAVFHLEVEFDDDVDERLIRFMVEENGCVDNHIDDLAESRDAEAELSVCFGCEVGEAFVGHLPLKELRSLACADEDESSEDSLIKAAQAIARARTIATEPALEPYLCNECGQPVANFRWGNGTLGPAIRSVRPDGTMCCESDRGIYPTQASAVGHLRKLRVHGRRRAQAGGGK